MQRAEAPQSLLPLAADVGVQGGALHAVVEEVGGGVAGDHDVGGDPPDRVDGAQAAAIVAVAPAGGPAAGALPLHGEGGQQQRQQDHKHRQLRQEVPPGRDAGGQGGGIEGQEFTLHGILHHGVIGQRAAHEAAEDPLVQAVAHGGVVEARRRQIQAPAEQPVHRGKPGGFGREEDAAQQHGHGGAVGPVPAVGQEHGGKEEPGGDGQGSLEPEFPTGGVEPGEIDNAQDGGAEHQKGGEQDGGIQFWNGVICLFHTNSITDTSEKNKGEQAVYGVFFSISPGADCRASRSRKSRTSTTTAAMASTSSAANWA